MSISFQERLESGCRLLIPFAGPSYFVGVAGERTAIVRGEVDLAVTPGNSQLSLFRFNLTSPGVATGEGGASTGHFGVHGIAGLGALEPQPGGTWAVHLEFLGVQAYEELTRRAGLTHVHPDRFMAPTENLAGALDGVISLTGEGTEAAIVFSGTIRFDALPGGQLKWVHSFQKAQTQTPVWPLFGWEAGRERRRRLKIRPVRLLSRIGDPKPTGAGAKAQTQFDAAQRIWGKCCIDLEILDPVDHVDPVLKTSGDPKLIVRALNDPDENTIEVFFVDHRLKSYGGGATLSCGWNTASVVLTEYSDHNDNLLAHELGHVFAGVHPNPPISSTFFWRGDVDTVLEAIIHANEANPDRNTLGNCQHADNPALMTFTPRPCVLRPDQRLP